MENQFPIVSAIPLSICLLRKEKTYHTPIHYNKKGIAVTKRYRQNNKRYIYGKKRYIPLKYLSRAPCFRIAVYLQQTHGDRGRDYPHTHLYRRKNRDRKQGRHGLANASLGHIHHEERRQKDAINDLKRWKWDFQPMSKACFGEEKGGKKEMLQ